MTVREAAPGELDALLELYLHLHEDCLPGDMTPFRRAWAQIMADENHHVVVCEAEREIVSSCVCVVVPNLTRSARPYALIENVVTRADCRHRGYASACLARAGFNDGDKTAFIRWINEE